MNILYIAPFKNFKSKDAGYGNASASMYNALEELKKDKIITSLDAINSTEKMDIVNKDKKYDYGFVVINPYITLQPENTKFLNEVLANCKHKILNILWETEPLPKGWKQLWDKDFIFDMFMSPTDFIIEQLKKETDKKIFKVPYYTVVPDKYKIDTKEKKNEKLFTVLFIGQNTLRKGIDDAIIAYSRAFDGIIDTQFIIKSYTLGKFEMQLESRVKYFASTNMSCKTAPIYILDRELSQEQVFELYFNSSLLLFPSRGEGFGLPPIEAMQIGIPTIYSNYSSLVEVMNGTLNYPVNCTIDEAVGMFEYGYEKGTKYGLPSMSSLIASLKEAYELWSNSKEIYYTTFSKNKEKILNKYNLETTKKALKEIICQPL